MNRKFYVLILLLSLLTACTSPTWEQDHDVQAAREACGALKGSEQYACYERQAVERSNPEICRLTGIWIDDACLQTVYEAADDATIYDRIYLQGVVPNCRAFYAHWTPETLTASITPPETTPTTNASMALGRLTVAQDGDVLLKGLPAGEITSLAQLLGIDNVSAISRPRLSPSGEWLAFRLKEPDGWVFVQQVDGSGSYDLEESGIQGLFAWSPVENWLAYVAGQGELKLTGEYGSEPRSLVPPSGNRQIMDLAWSPDGKWIAYSVGERKGLGDTYLGIWKVPIEGGEPVELYASRDFEIGAGVYRLLGWTPDSGNLVFWEGNPYFSASLAADGLPLALLPAEGGEPVRLAESVLPYDDFVRPDPSGSGRIAVVVGGSRDATDNKVLYVIESSKGTNVSPAGYAASSPAWSPDGCYLAYVALPAAGNMAGGEPLQQALMGRKLWLYDLQTGQSSQITHDPVYRDEYPLWSADGATLLFVRMDEKNRVSVWSLAIHGGELRMLLDNLSIGGQGWFGYYGHIPWYEMMDWWQGR